MKIPDNAKLVFKGVMFDTYQWEQEMFDGSKEIFEMLKRPDTVQIIATGENEKVFIGLESQPTKKNFLTLFGGRVDEGEDPMDAAKRELLEEAGLAAKSWELVKVVEPYTKMDWHIYLYIAKGCHKVAEQKLDAGEIIEVKEVNFDEFVEAVLSDDFLGKEISDLVTKSKLNNNLEELKNKIF